ncbi:hypothetical protein VTJ49DRAFT_2650 [Mycothermus thermophilus]|uniref:Serine hydrolase domain-containing protein n=1 Tax=Humicola insolens TaxID=85995 RepID=A0ABR3V9L3_HUMIN
MNAGKGLGEPGRAAAGTTMMQVSQATNLRWHLSAQRLSLAVLVVQNSVLVMVMHHSRNRPTGSSPRYYASTAVLLVELIKLLASLVLTTHHTWRNRRDARPSELATLVFQSVFAPDSWKLIVPAALYTLQNSLVYVAVSNLDAVTFQVTYQLKILTTVLFSIVLLGRSITRRQWLALVMLTVGVAVVQGSGLIGSGNWLERLTLLIRGETLPTSGAFRGLLAVVVASVISGLTCVYFEKLVKDSLASVSLWTRNVQLSFFSLFPALFIGVLWQDGASIRRDGFFVGYDALVWTTISLQALGGLVVAVCIAYADNVAKNFAASLSIVVSYAATAVLFGTPMSLQATAGGMIVIAAMYLFNKPASRPQIGLLPVSQEADREKSRPLLVELIPLSHAITMGKPKVVFLHGSGTNADIFRLQARKLHALLEPHFHLIYLNAPIPCPPGPGVLPFFEGCDPYLAWLDDTTPASEQAFWAGNEIANLAREIRQLGDVVAIVGFSQGAKIAMEVVRRLEEEGSSSSSPSPVKIVLSICGTAPFHGGLIGGGGKGEQDPEREALYQESLKRGVVKAESVHWIAERDPWKAESDKLVDFFDETTRKVIRARGGHHMPLDDKANEQLAKLVTEAVKR